MALLMLWKTLGATAWMLSDLPHPQVVLICRLHGVSVQSDGF